MVKVAHFQHDAHNPNSIDEFKLWLEARNRHAWIEPLGDEDTLRTYLKENHPESLDGNHPVYLFVDESFEEHKLMLVGSTPITLNFLKNFKRLYNETEQEREDEAAEKEALPPVLSNKKSYKNGAPNMLKELNQFQKEAKQLGRNENSVNEFILWLEARSQSKTALSDEANKFISDKISKLHDEGYEGDQAIAIAHEYARDAGYDVPSPKSSYTKTKKKADPDPEPEADFGPDEDLGDQIEDVMEHEDDPEKEAKQLMALWEKGEMSLKELHHHILEEYGTEQEEENIEDIVFDLIDKHVKELKGETEDESESESELEEEEEEEGVGEEVGVPEK